MDKMVIAGKDKRYMRGLYEYFLSHYGKEYEMVLFDRISALEEYLKENRASVLIAEEEIVKSFESDNIGTKIYLTEERESEDRNAIYKYMSCENIFKEVMAIQAAGQVADSLSMNSDNKLLIGVYTPIKRCLQTTFSLTAGQILAKKRKTLYLNFECYSGFEALCDREFKTDLMDLVYFSECDYENFSCRVGSIKESIGDLDYISPVKAYVKFSEVGKKQWERLIDNLLCRTDYEVIILDLSEQVNGLLDILRKCDRVYTITDEERVASAKVMQYENLLKESAYEDVLNKTYNIKLPKFREIPGKLEMLPFGEIAQYVKKILEIDGGESDGK